MRPRPREAPLLEEALEVLPCRVFIDAESALHDVVGAVDNANLLMLKIHIDLGADLLSEHEVDPHDVGIIQRSVEVFRDRLTADAEALGDLLCRFAVLLQLNDRRDILLGQRLSPTAPAAPQSSSVPFHHPFRKARYTARDSLSYYHLASVN